MLSFFLRIFVVVEFGSEGRGGSSFVFVVDGCASEDEIRARKNELLLIVAQLPENAIVGLVVFDAMVKAMLCVKHDGRCSRAMIIGKPFVHPATMDLRGKCEKSLVVDVPTRWNSTYMMLSVAIKYERIFDRFTEEDYVYTCDLRECDGDEFEDDKKEGPLGV
ncbi:protein transport protein Sec23 [Tanacetum coccineum]